MQSHQADHRHARTLIKHTTLAVATLTFTACFTTADQLTPEELGVTQQAIDDDAQVVISQVYGGGQSGSGAPDWIAPTYGQDYVELFNRSDRDVQLVGYSLQYGSYTGNIGLTRTLPSPLFIAAGAYYLIQLNNTVPIPLPNVVPDFTTAGLSISQQRGKLALVRSVAPLQCGGATPCSQSQLDSIVDLVGYGLETTSFEGAGSTGDLTKTTVALRVHDGCTDTNNNNADLVIGAPALRNSASPRQPCNMFVRASSTGSTTCAVRRGQAMCWGSNTSGKLGQGNTSTYGAGVSGFGLANLQLIDVGPGRTILDLTVGNSFVCARLDNNSLKCWGNASNIGLGGAGANRGDQPNEMGSNLTAVDLAGNTTMLGQAGGAHVCVRIDGAGTPLKCFGANNAAQVGWGNAPSGAYTVLGDAIGETGTGNPPVPTGGIAGTTVVASAGGGEHNCVITSDNKVRCWGANNYGQLGRQSNVTPWGDTPTEMATLHEVFVGTGRYAVAIAAGAQHTCVVRDNGSIVCWGNNASGQLGRNASGGAIGDAAGELDDDTDLVAVSLGTGRTAVAISAGDHHTCALLDNGSVTCWGAGSSGQLGRGTTGSSSSGGPTVILGAGRTALSIAAGASYTCAALDDFTVKCWGSNAVGALGYDLNAVSPNNAIGDTSLEMNALGTEPYTVDLIF